MHVNQVFLVFATFLVSETLQENIFGPIYPTLTQQRLKKEKDVVRPYEFAYGVHDPKSHVSHSRSEQSDGVEVEGEYRTLLPDGRTQVVRYRSGPGTGFVADVSYIGEAAKTNPQIAKRQKRKNRFLNIRGKKNKEKKSNATQGKQPQQKQHQSYGVRHPSDFKTLLEGSSNKVQSRVQGQQSRQHEQHLGTIYRQPTFAPVVRSKVLPTRVGHFIPRHLQYQKSDQFSSRHQYQKQDSKSTDQFAPRGQQERQFSQVRPVYVKPNEGFLKNVLPNTVGNLKKYGIMTDISSKLPTLPPLSGSKNPQQQQQQHQGQPRQQQHQLQQEQGQQVQKPHQDQRHFHGGWASQVVLPPDKKNGAQKNKKNNDFEIEEVFDYQGPIFVQNNQKNTFDQKQRSKEPVVVKTLKQNHNDDKNKKRKDIEPKQFRAINDDFVRQMPRNPLKSVRPNPQIKSAATNVVVRKKEDVKDGDFVKKVRNEGLRKANEHQEREQQQQHIAQLPVRVLKPQQQQQNGYSPQTQSQRAEQKQEKLIHEQQKRGQLGEVKSNIQGQHIITVTQSWEESRAESDQHFSQTENHPVIQEPWKPMEQQQQQQQQEQQQQHWHDTHKQHNDYDKEKAAVNGELPRNPFRFVGLKHQNPPPISNGNFRQPRRQDNNRRTAKPAGNIVSFFKNLF